MFLKLILGYQLIFLNLFSKSHKYTKIFDANSSTIIKFFSSEILFIKTDPMIVELLYEHIK